MKKLLVVLLSLGLIAAFAAPASALDVKFGGEYYIAGGYNQNPELRPSEGAYSRAAFRQRMRILTIFQVAEGLTLTTRFDALEKTWGSNNWSGNTNLDGDKTGSRKAVPTDATGTVLPIAATAQTTAVKPGATKVQENIEMEWGYVTFKTGLGQFDVGYQNCDAWGTLFSNASSSRPAIKYATVFGPVVFGLAYEKWVENDVLQTSVAAAKAATATAGATAQTWFKTDADSDTYAMYGIYKFKGGEAGLLYKYYADSTNRIAAVPYKSLIHHLSPYAKATFGPIALETEVNWFFGKAAKYDEVAGAVAPADIDADTLTAYIKGQMNMGPAYFGGQYAYASGSDEATTVGGAVNPKYVAKQILGMNTSYQPTWIIGGGEALNDIGDMCKLGGVNGTTGMDDKKYNTVFYNIFAGYNVTPKLNLEAEVTYAEVAKKPVGYDSKKLGTEVGVVAKYKIYDNLSYYVAAAYLFAGDYWKGAQKADGTYGTINDTYVLLNKLTLSF